MQRNSALHFGEVQMKQGFSEIVFILDRSGSMAGLEKDTIGSFNSTIEKQKQEPGTACVSTVLFDNDTEVLHDRVDISQIEPMTEKQYCVRGCTALIDAIGGAIHHIGNVHKYAREEDRPEKTIFIIITDDQENASRRYSAGRVRQMVNRQKTKYGWEFLFFGANIDAVETADRFGISKDRAANFCNDERGIEIRSRVQAEMLHRIRCSESIPEDWKAELEEDHRRRGR